MLLYLSCTLVFCILLSAFYYFYLHRMLLFYSTCSCFHAFYPMLFTFGAVFSPCSPLHPFTVKSVLLYQTVLPLKLLPPKDPACSGTALSPVELLWEGCLISADIYGHCPICCMFHSFHALPEVLCNYPDIDEGWFQQVIAGSSAVFTNLSKMSLSINSGKLISTQWPYLLLII